MNIDHSIPPEVVREEFYRSTEKFHVIACWVGLILNMFWFISDYLVLPDHWITFFLFRLAVSVITIFSVIFRKKLGITIYTCMFIVVLGISIQNSYMWSVMDLEHLHQHTFAYMVLFIGAGMLVLWEFRFSVILIVATIASNLIFYKLNSSLTMEQFLINGGLLTLTVALFCAFLIRSRYKLTYNEIRGRLELEKSKKMIEAERNIVVHQKQEIELKNKEITDSITYAKRLQEAILPPQEFIHTHTPENFVLYKPKDIVAGDFYWAEAMEELFFIAAADSTGHGVPGAMVSVVCSNALNRAVNEFQITETGKILDKTRELVLETFSKSSSEVKDGMDISLLCIDRSKKEVYWSGANNPLWYIVASEGTLTEITADKQPIGKTDDPKPFKSNRIEYNSGTIYYLFTDGYADQFGGPKGKKFKYKQLQDLLVSIHKKPMNEQSKALDQSFNEWRGNLEQVDDVCIIGIRI